MRIWLFQSLFKEWFDVFPSSMKPNGKIEDEKAKKKAVKTALRNSAAQGSAQS
jgi:hypothetical protein